jgi:ATP-dependent Clp protease ATP-binding subunit ClpC
MNEEQYSTLDVMSLRARKARTGKHIGKNGHAALVTFAVILFVVAVVALLARMPHLPGIAAGLGLIFAMLAEWWQHDLAELPVQADGGLTDRLSTDALALLPTRQPLTPRSVWQAFHAHWQSIFIMNHLYVPDAILTQTLKNDEAALAAVWSAAAALADENGSQTIEIGHIIGALALSSPEFLTLLTQQKMRPEDIRAVVAWLCRGVEMIGEKPHDYGGIGRDWANGYTPHLDQFGYNISLGIERSGSHYGWLSHSASVQAMKNAFSQGATAVALVGETGSGKTSHVYALAQTLLEEKKDPSLEHRQTVSLSASMIVSSATRPGELEYIVSTLLGEAAHAGHIILFFDDAELFFSQGTGTFDATKLLLPVLQSRALQLIFAFTPHSWQALKSTNTALTSLMTPVALPEMPETDVMRVLEDSTLGFEHRHNVIITYDALRETYRLSGRYETEVAYPGKAINLLEQAVAQAENGVVAPLSVQRAIEQSRGVKVADVTAVESDTLLNLEDNIHERMINQSHAVSVVANALRRARAGVANPKRPIGSFLFLGPTGVGKTELAKAISAVYFGAEAGMIRLDMSEYQDPDDVKRLLSDGKEETRSLIMSVRQQPFGVVLLDEIEKAHPNVLNLLLQLLDEGQLTDTGGRMASFKDCVIICTSNAGADTIRERVSAGEPLEKFEDEFTDQLIKSGQFKPELLNRFDEMVLFRPLTPEELLQVVALMMKEVNATLAPQNISVSLTEDAARKIVEVGYDPRLGARPMRRVLQRAVEDVIAGKILRGDLHPGDRATLDISDLAL